MRYQTRLIQRAGFHGEEVQLHGDRRQPAGGKDLRRAAATDLRLELHHVAARPATQVARERPRVNGDASDGDLSVAPRHRGGCRTPAVAMRSARSPTKAAKNCAACSSARRRRGDAVADPEQPVPSAPRRRRKWRRKFSRYNGKIVQTERSYPRLAAQALWEEIRARTPRETPSWSPSHEPMMSSGGVAAGMSRAAGGHEEGRAGAHRRGAFRAASRTACCVDVDSARWPEVTEMKFAQGHGEVRGLARPSPAHLSRPTWPSSTSRCAPRQFPVPARHLSIAGRRSCRKSAANSAARPGAGRGRSARGELRNLARYRRAG